MFERTITDFDDVIKVAARNASRPGYSIITSTPQADEYTVYKNVPAKDFVTWYDRETGLFKGSFTIKSDK